MYCCFPAPGFTCRHYNDVVKITSLGLLRGLGVLVFCEAEELEMASIGTQGLSVTSALSLHIELRP